MILELKNYQRRALDVLADFFTRARQAPGEAGIQAAFHAALAAQDYAPDEIPPYLSQGFESHGRVTPYVCLRIPTGGGKTLLGTHALALAWQNYAEALSELAKPLALWLVPSNAIRSQTLTALRTPGHPYRETLAEHFGVDGFRVLDIAEVEQLRVQDFGSKAIVVVGTLQTLRVDDTSGRDVYAYKECFEPHFAKAPDLPEFERVTEKDLAAQPYLGRQDLGRVKRSFANLMQWHRPLVIVDEAHNARTPLTYDTFARLNPAALIELTATPIREGKHRSNVLFHVSAEALKAEEMIKLPIVLHAHPNWQEAVRDALLTRKRLAVEAQGEKDYLRPILLLQAENKAGEVTVERLREHLLTVEHVAAASIAVATGNQRDLEGVNLFDPACPVEVVITVEALKEGWDCSFAYVFCSLQKIGSSRDMEQLLGRVLRMPYASSRRSPLLNRAYAHLASPRSQEVANALADRLVAMGFEELEAAQAVFPTSLPLFDGSLMVPTASEPLELTLAAPLALDAELAEELAALTTPPSQAEAAAPGTPTPAAEPLPLTSGSTLRLHAAPSPALQAALVAAGGDKKTRMELDKQLTRFALQQAAQLSPSQRGTPFATLPLLCVRDTQGELDLAEREVLLDLAGFDLSALPAALPAFTPDSDPKPYVLDMQGGKVGIAEEEAVYSVNLDLVQADITENDLLRWLDGRLRDSSSNQIQRLEWLSKVLHWLQREGGHTLTALYRHRNSLCDALRERLTTHQANARKTGFQLAFFSNEPRGCISADYTFRFRPGIYPAHFTLPPGRYRFQKHYYAVIGDLKEASSKQTDHEYHCAVAIDGLPQVKHWVRNIAQVADFSFWLPTATDRFYPDFVAELHDGRLLVVEYKGEGFKTATDASVKRQIGESWAKITGNLFLMAEEKDPDGRNVIQQLQATLAAAPALPRLVEHQCVRLRQKLASASGEIATGSQGTVLVDYGQGQAYAVEFITAAGEMEVLTVPASWLEAQT